MSVRIDSLSNAKLPRWLVITASAAGLLMLGVGMSRFLRMSPVKDALLPMLVGSMLIYISGFEKRLFMDEEGVCQSKSFWGRKKETRVPWEEIDDARVILDKGKSIYVLLHGAEKIPPFILNRNQSDEVIGLLRGKLAEGRVNIEG